MTTGGNKRIPHCLFKHLGYLRAILTASAIGILTGCSTEAPSVMEPYGPAAQSIADLAWIFFILAGIIFILVMAYLAYALLIHRPGAASPRGGTWIVIIAGMIIPGIILLVLFVLNTNVLGKVTAPNEEDAAATIRVTGNQWWWKVEYPELQILTANEIHIPVGKPVLLELTSEDVIHSFWVPELHGKMDLIPGRTNKFWIQADEAGEYLGECAEYCGLQHAKMRFIVVAESQEAFNLWVESNQQEAELPEAGSEDRGLDIFLSANCVQCHTIRGTDAAGTVGPDLTHLASRRTIGAGTLPLDRSNLLSWVANPHGVKEGVFMPPSNVDGEDLQDLVDFLLSLE